MESLDWQETQMQKLASKTEHYTQKEKTKVGYSYLKSALYTVPEKVTNESDLQEFKANTVQLIDSLPSKKDGSLMHYGTYSSALSSYKQDIKKKYNLVSKGTYVNQGILGMPVGLLLGILLGNLVFGLLIGLTVGLTIGALLENKAKKENRLLDG